MKNLSAIQLDRNMSENSQTITKESFYEKEGKHLNRVVQNNNKQIS